jgi:hypothetical protein
MPYRFTTIGMPKVFVIAATWLASFTLPIRSIVMLTICFIAADFVIGIITSYRVHKKGFETVKAWRTAFKLAGALTSIMAAYGIEVFIFETGDKYLSRGVAGILCGFDFYSMVANFAMLSNHPAFRVIKKFVKSEIESKIKRATSMDKEAENGSNEAI